MKYVHRVAFLFIAAVLSAGFIAWGDEGHEMAGLIAAESLPGDMPAFFRDAAPQLAYLNPEPDRWRGRDEQALDPAMNAHHAVEHYVNFENVPPQYFDAPSRYDFIDSLHTAGMDVPGLLTFRILELTQRLRVGFRDWRAADDERTRRYVEERIINDAGILGHYVTDGANPHHTTVHHNGWADGYPNPRGFTGDDSFHWRFESTFVRNHITIDDVRVRATTPARVFEDVRGAVLDFLQESHSHLETLYALEQQESFTADTRGEGHAEFAAERLARGAEMLRDLWWTAWVTSE